MAGGGDTPALVAAVSEAGALGFIGAAYLSGEQIIAAAKDVRSKTSKPYGINLFAPSNVRDGAADLVPMLRRLATYAAELGIPAPTASTAAGLSFDEQARAVAETDAAVFSFTFGIPSAETLRLIKARRKFILGTATTVDEAIALEAAGVDAVIAQGSEAGGHRGTFAAEFLAAMIGTMALVPQVVDALRIPVVAAGGIMDGRGIAAALTLGASGVQMGTAFLTCDEAGPPPVYKETILKSREHETRVTRAFSGRFARGIANRMMQEIDADPSEIAPFPIQNSLTRPIRTAATKQGRPEYLSLWAGQGLRLSRRAKASELVDLLARETEAALARRPAVP
jgi:nitronate monooxygenase